MFKNIPVLIRGAGDLASGVSARLWRSGFPVVMTELPCPLAIRRKVAFAEAVYAGETTVEGITARRVTRLDEVRAAWEERIVPVLVDPLGDQAAGLHARVVVDARLAKRNLGIRLIDAPLVIALGPGFTAGKDAHAVIETNRGHYLGRVIWNGSAQADTGTPGEVGGLKSERVIYAPADGVFEGRVQIGDRVERGDTVGLVAGFPALAAGSGVVRGLIHDGLAVYHGMKIGDVDPRGSPEYCWTISEKALAVGGGVLEAILSWLHTNSLVEEA